MEDKGERALRLAKPNAEELLADFTAEQLDGIRRRVRSSIEVSLQLNSWNTKDAKV